MCIVLLALDVVPGYPLVLAGNRDEFLDRPSAPAGWWPDAPRILGGRDLRSGGTWLGVTRGGRLAVVTNVREPGRNLAGAPSRGDLAAGYLRSSLEAGAYAAAVAERGGAYNGFNLLVGRAGRIAVVSNRGEGVRVLRPGRYGLSNARLDTPWPKVTRGKSLFEDALAPGGPPDVEALFAVLADGSVPGDDVLPETGVGLEVERALSPILVRAPGYGTRVSTVVTVSASGRLTLEERDAPGSSAGADPRRFAFDIEEEA